MDQLLFLIFAAMAVAGAVNLLRERHPIYSALSLIAVMGALAVLYWLLGAEFIAAVQVIVYAGAIMVLFVLVIMLLNVGEEARTRGSPLARYLGFPLLVLLLAPLVVVLHREDSFAVPAQLGAFVGRTGQIGRLLFYDYVLPFEVTSVLILVAIMGAVVLAGRKL